MNFWENMKLSWRKCFQWHDPLHHKTFGLHLPLLHRTSWVGNPFSVMEIPDISMQDLVSKLWFPLTSHWNKKSMNYHWLNFVAVSLKNIWQHLTLQVSQNLFVWCWIFTICSHKKYHNVLNVAPRMTMHLSTITSDFQWHNFSHNNTS